MSPRDRREQARVAPAAATEPSHVCLGAGLVNEDKTFGLKPELPLGPVLTLSGNVGAILLRRPAGFFIAVTQRAQRGVDRLLRDIDALARKLLLEFGQRDVRRRGHHGVQPILPTGKLSLLLAADPARRVAPRLAPAPNQIDRTGRD